MLEQLRRRSTRSPTRSRADGLHRRGAARHGRLDRSAPEVIRRSFGDARRRPAPARARLDRPGAVARGRRTRSTSSKTLFIVSSKSGGTIETLSQFKHFQLAGRDGAQLRRGHRPGHVARAARRRARLPARVPRTTRTSAAATRALSYFGLVPGGADGRRHRARCSTRRSVAEQSCQHYDAQRQPGPVARRRARRARARRAATSSRSSSTTPIASFGLWVEQLVAESTGKQGKGILPVADEPLGDPDAYGDDRVFAAPARPTARPTLDARIARLATAGHPVITHRRRAAPSDLGRIFFLAEFADRGGRLGARRSTRSTSPTCRRPRTTPSGCSDEGAAGRPSDRRRRCATLLDGAAPPQLRRDHGLRASRRTSSTRRSPSCARAIRDATRATTTFGYGPRFLHSTGQFHKGGPPTGALPAARPRRPTRTSRSRAPATRSAR